MFQFQSISGSSLTLSLSLWAYTKVLSSSNRRLWIEDEAEKRQLNVHVNGPHQPNRLCHSFEQHLLTRLCEMDCRKTKSNCKLWSTSCGRISYKFRSFCCCFRLYSFSFFSSLGQSKNFHCIIHWGKTHTTGKMVRVCFHSKNICLVILLWLLFVFIYLN